MSLSNSSLILSLFDISDKDIREKMDSRQRGDLNYSFKPIVKEDKLKFQTKKIISSRDKYSQINYYTYDNYRNIKKCHYCLCTYDGEKIGYPTKYWESTDVVEGMYVTTFNYVISGSFCSFNCALAFLRRDAFGNGESLIHSMFYLLHPDKELTPAKSYLLLDENGGPLKREEWEEERIEYKRTNRIKIYDSARVHNL